MFHQVSKLSKQNSNNQRIRKKFPIAALSALGWCSASWALPSSNMADFAYGMANESAHQSNQRYRHFDISAGKLSDALVTYLKDSRISIKSSDVLSPDDMTAGLHGNYTDEEALNVLLSNTHIHAVALDSGDYELRSDRRSKAYAKNLSAVNVTASNFGAETPSTATGMNLSVRETPQSISVIDRQRMDDQGMVSIADALKNTTAISVTQSESNRYSFTSRGFNITNFQYDGIDSIYNVANPYGAGTTDLAFYDHVEVIRGANGLMSGTGNPSATVNLVRKVPTAETEASVDLTVGSWNQKRGQFDLSGPLTTDGRIRGRAVAVYESSDSFINNWSQKKALFYGVVDADITDDTMIRAGIDYQRFRTDGATFGGIPTFYTNGARTDLPRSTTTGTDWTGFNTDSETIFASSQTRINEYWTMKTTVNHQIDRYDGEVMTISLSPFLNQATGGGLLGYSLRLPSKRTRDTFDQRVTGEYELFGQDQDFMAGVNATQVTENTDSVKATPLIAPISNFYLWSGSYFPEPVYGGRTNLSYTTTHQYSGYAATRLNFSSSLHVILGARYIDWKQDVRTPTSDKRYVKNPIWTPYAGIIADLNETYSVYTSVTRIFNPQSQKGLDNNPLNPVVGTDYEVGIKGEYLDGKASVALDVYKIRQDNLAQIVTPTVILSDGSSAYRAVKGATTHGAELELNGRLADGWRLNVGLAYNQSRDAAGNAINTTQPRRTAKVFTTYRLPGTWSRLTVGGGGTYQSDVYQVVAVGKSSFRVDQRSYAIASLMARFEFNDHLSTSLNIDNAFDKHYYTSAIGSTEFYGEPTKVQINARYTF